jgi:hypothetical protein
VYDKNARRLWQSETWKGWEGLNAGTPVNQGLSRCFSLLEKILNTFQKTMSIVRPHMILHGCCAATFCQMLLRKEPVQAFRRVGKKAEDLVDVNMPVR